MNSWARFAAVALAYVLAGKLGLSLAFVHASATAVWPPSGIAIASLLLFGTGLWPAIFAGAFLVNLTTTGSLATSLVIAAGNTLEALIAAGLTRRFAGGVEAFDQPRTLVRFVVLICLFATPAAATIGVTTLALGAEAEWTRFGSIWLTWWLGDAVGATVVAPLLVLWFRRRRGAESRRPLEALLLAACLLLVTAVIFGGALELSRQHLPIGFLCLPIGLWAALRLGPFEAAASTVAVAAVALWGTIQGFGPYAAGSDHQAIALLQAFIGVSGVTVLVVATLVQNGRDAEANVRRLNDALEQRVLDRTARLAASNRDLLAEIEERQRAERDRERSEARLVEAQEVARIGSWEWEIAGNRIWWSEELHRIFGVAPGPAFDPSYEAFIGRVHPDDRSFVDGAVRAALAAAQPFAFEHRLLTPDGVMKWVAARGHVVSEADGRILRMAGTAQDITDWKRLEQERVELFREQAARQQADEANRQKDAFLATLSHELRTPLNAILGWLQILRARPLDPATHQTLDILDRNAATLRRLIEDVLDVSAIVSGKLRLSVQPVDFRLPVSAAVESVRPSAASRRIAVRTSGWPDELLVTGDPERLQQVAANLLVNAIKFTDDGGRVDVEIARDGDAAVFRVRDTGIGIDAELLPHVFDQFRQGDSSVTRAHGGLGLGLAIARHVMTLHGGSVAVESPGAGGGAVFTVRMPLLPALRQGIDSAPAAAVALRPGHDLDGLDILAVDDDDDARKLLHTALGMAGADVRVAGSVREALALIDARRPDAILLDIAMPGEDGYMLIRDLHARGVAVPCIAVSAHAGPQDRARALAAGFVEHMGKPLDLPRLIAAVARLGGKASRASAGADVMPDAESRA